MVSARIGVFISAYALLFLMYPFTQLSSRSHYGIIFLSFLAQAQSAPVSTNHVAKETGISQGYLEEIARALKEGGIIKGKRGATGGYQLAKPADQVSLQDVFEALEGKLALVPCLDSDDRCSVQADFEHSCVSRKVIGRLQKGIIETLGSIRLSEFIV